MWDQNEETAIQSPHGGVKVTWSGSSLIERTGRDRVRLVLAIDSGAELRGVVTRLERLGRRGRPARERHTPTTS